MFQPVLCIQKETETKPAIGRGKEAETMYLVHKVKQNLKN